MAKINDSTNYSNRISNFELLVPIYVQERVSQVLEPVQEKVYKINQNDKSKDFFTNKKRERNKLSKSKSSKSKNSSQGLNYLDY